MRRGRGGWQELGHSIDEAVRAGKPTDRAAIVDRCAVEMGRNPAGLRRLYEAYLYVSRFPGGVETTAPMAAVEVLARIDQRDFVLAARLRPRLFNGELTIREVADEERNMIVRLAGIPAAVRDLSFEAAIARLEHHPAFRMTPLGEYASASAHGKSIGATADGALPGTDEPSWALVVSPHIRCSTLFGRDLSDLLDATTKALLFYDHAFVLVGSDEERNAVESYFNVELRIRDPGRRETLLRSLHLIGAIAA